MVSTQKEYFELLEKVGMGPVYVSTSYLNSSNEFVPGNRIFVEGITHPPDYRTVFSNELIFEIDARSWAECISLTDMFRGTCERLDIKSYTFVSGGKGIHTHVFFNPFKFKNDEQKKVFEQAIQKGLTFKKVREFLFFYLIDLSGIRRELCGPGKVVDTSSLTFSDEHHKTRLIRVCGGRKMSMGKDNFPVTTYKSFVSGEEYEKIRGPKRKPKIADVKDVKYPEEIVPFDIPEIEFMKYLSDFVERNKDAPITSKRIPLNGKYVDLPGVKKIREGTPVGMRAMGAKILAIALRNDDAPISEAEEVMREYARTCSQAGEPFTEKESLSWLKWVYDQTDIFWSPSLLKSLGPEYDIQDEYVEKASEESLKLLSDPDLLKKIDEIIGKIIVGERETRILIFLLCNTKIFIVDEKWNIASDPRPSSVILSSPSSSGKSFLIKAIISLFGRIGRNVHYYSRMTDGSLNYFSQINMNNSILALEELQGMDKATIQLRVWISEGSLTLATVEDVLQEDGTTRKELVERVSIGQPMFLSSTAEDLIDEQLNNRSWVISLDISAEQTKYIIEMQSRLAKNPLESERPELQIIREALATLKPYHYIIPFYDNEFLKMPYHDIRARRDFKKLRELMCSNANLHQFQRTIVEDQDGRQYVVVSLEDYEVARKYAANILSTTFLGLSNIQYELLKMLKNSDWKEKEFLVSDIIRMTGWTQKKSWSTLTQLNELGYLTMKSEGRSNVYTLNDTKVHDAVVFPTTDVLLKRMCEKYNISYEQFTTDLSRNLSPTFPGSGPMSVFYQNLPFMSWKIVSQGNSFDTTQGKVRERSGKGIEKNSEILSPSNLSTTNGDLRDLSPIPQKTPNKFVNLNGQDNHLNDTIDIEDKEGAYPTHLGIQKPTGLTQGERWENRKEHTGTEKREDGQTFINNEQQTFKNDPTSNQKKVDDDNHIYTGPNQNEVETWMRQQKEFTIDEYIKKFGQDYQDAIFERLLMFGNIAKIKEGRFIWV